MAQHFHIAPDALNRMSLAEVMAVLAVESDLEKFERRAGVTVEEAEATAEAAFARLDKARAEGRLAPRKERAGGHDGLVDRLVGKVTRRRRERAKAKAHPKGQPHGD